MTGLKAEKGAGVKYGQNEGQPVNKVKKKRMIEFT